MDAVYTSPTPWFACGVSCLEPDVESLGHPCRFDSTVRASTSQRTRVSRSSDRRVGRWSSPVVAKGTLQRMDVCLSICPFEPDMVRSRPFHHGIFPLYFGRAAGVHMGNGLARAARTSTHSWMGGLGALSAHTATLSLSLFIHNNDGAVGAENRRGQDPDAVPEPSVRAKKGHET
nr:hypothetical protein [Pandoravirus massiliensis]